LSRQFGACRALDGVSLEVPAGSVLGLIGRNAAGKTTLIQHLLGLLRAQQGSVRVFGLDPVARPAEVLARIGYLSENPSLPGWMRLGELLRYTEAFYPRWDRAFADSLCRDFELDSRQRVRALSRGQQVRAALVCALAHRPELMVLDEPSSGLDPVVRKDVLEAIVHTVGEDGRTVIFSSHLLDEVERMSDRLVILANGRVTAAGPLEEIRRAHCRLTVALDAPCDLLGLPGVLWVRHEEDESALICAGDATRVELDLEAAGCRVLEHRAASLDEIFLARSRGPAR
jgi:ABC-2 type transport system ATP-binding protein